MTRYRVAAEVERIARELIPLHHPHLADQHLRYLFIDPPAHRHGKLVLGRANLISGRAAYLLALQHLDPADAELLHIDGKTHQLFVIEIADVVWPALEIGERRALVDHELTHCHVGEDSNGDPARAIRGHDIEEFQEVLERHGIWRPELRAFARTVEQLTLESHWAPVDG